MNIGDSNEPKGVETREAGALCVDEELKKELEVVGDHIAPAAILNAKVYTVLLIGHDLVTKEKVRDALPQNYELITAQGADAGCRAARICAPDIILFDTSNGDLKTLKTLRDDPLSGNIPVVIVGDPDDDDSHFLDHQGLFDHVQRPVNVVELRGLMASIAEGSVHGERLLKGDLGEAKLSDVVEFVQRELDHWVLEAAGPGAHNVKIKLGDSGDLMGAVWAFVARFRELISRGSEGLVSFRALEEGRVSMLSLTTSAESERLDEADIVTEHASPESIELLKGLRAVVADDDEEVRSLFTAVLSEVGMEVEAVRNGREALLAVRQRRPDVIITDIVMPVMDGWELLRRLRHDVLVRDIPVVVLSWKEDFLQRMKDLEADADAYMMKEMDRNNILLRICEVLSSRLSVEKRLLEEETLAGRVEAVGIVPLLRALIRHGGERTLVVREAWNLIEIRFANGRVVNVSNTTSGGLSSRGMTALRTLIGVRRGRFTVMPCADDSAESLGTDLAQLLSEAGKPIREMIESVDRGALVRVARVKLRDDVIREYLEVAPKEIRDLILRLSQGESPRELILSGDFAAQELERVVLDLILRGAVDRIEAPVTGATSQVDSAGDEERWAVIGGATPSPRTPDSREEELVSIPTVLPPVPVDQTAPPSAATRRGGRSRILLYLAIVAAAALALSRLYGDRDEPAEDIAFPAAVAPIHTSERTPSQEDTSPYVRDETSSAPQAGITSDASAESQSAGDATAGDETRRPGEEPEGGPPRSPSGSYFIEPRPQ